MRAHDFIQAFNDRDWDSLEETLAADCEYEELVSPIRRVRGAREVRKIYEGWGALAPSGSKGKVIEAIESGDGIAAEVEWSGFGETPYGSYPSTAAAPTARTALFCRFDEDGRIRRLCHYYDSMVVQHALGLNPGRRMQVDPPSPGAPPAAPSPPDPGS